MELVDNSTKDPHMLVKKGETCVFHCSDGRKFFLATHEKMRVGKSCYSISCIIGEPYGSVFEVQGKKLTRVSGGLFPDPVAPETGDAIVPDADNRSYVDNNSSQKLSADHIANMKEQGASGHDIIDALVKSSDTWESKTEFSKQKYLTKKQQKYIPRVRVLRLTGQLLCQLYHDKSPEKILGIRDDTIAQILHYGNIFAGVKVFIMDECLGLVVGAIAERMGGIGQIFHAYSTFNTTECLRLFNFRDDISSSISHFPLRYISLLDQSEEEIATIYKDMTKPVSEEVLQQREQERKRRNDQYTEQQRKARDLRKSKKEIRKAKQLNPPQIRDGLRNQVDSLILTCTFDPCVLLERLFPLLKISGVFVIYSQFIEPLSLAFQQLQKSGNAIKMQLNSTWTREYQVLPSRTHPEMVMSACGGYLLSGIKVNNSTDFSFASDYKNDSNKRQKQE